MLKDFAKIGAQYVAQSALNQQAFSQNKELARIGNQFNIDQWNRENAYNDPSAQMARLRGAGLNPNLMYGNGTTSTGIAGQLSGNLQAGTPINPVDMSSILLAQSQAELNQATSDKVKAETDYQKILTEWLPTDKLQALSLTNEQIKKLGSEISTLESQLQTLHDTNTDFNYEITDKGPILSFSYGHKKSDKPSLYRKQLEATIANLYKDADVKDSQILKYDAETETIIFDLSLAKDYKELETQLGLFGRLLQTLSHFIPK